MVRAALCLGAGAALSGLSSAVWAQNATDMIGVARTTGVAGSTRTVYFYSGAGQAEGRPGTWGNGEEAKATDVDYENADALKVTTRNLNEGIRFDLPQPIDLTPYLAPGANGLVRLRVRFASGFGGRGQGFPGQGQGPGYPGQGQGFPGRAPGRVQMQGFPTGANGDNQGFTSAPGGGEGGGEGGPFPGEGGGGDAGGDVSNGQDGGGDMGGVMEQLVSPALAKPRTVDPGSASVQQPQDPQARTSSLPRLLGAPQTRALAQYGDPGGGRGGAPGGYPGGGAPRGYPQGGAPGGYPGGMGGMGGMMTPPQRTSIGRFQVVMVLDRGTMTGGIDFSMRSVRADDAGWRLLTIPLTDMRATPGASGLVRRVIITTDKEDTWYLGQAALSVDAKQIAISLRRPEDAPGAQIAEITVKPGPLTLVADVEAGASDVAVDWNFDADNAGAPAMAPAAGPGMGAPGEVVMPPGQGGEAMGGGAPMGGEGGMAQAGPRVDAHGLIAKFDYPNEEQNYRVEVTVRDRSGKKQAIKAQILVKIRG